MLLKEYLDINKLEQHIADGYVEQRFHKEFPLVLYVYGRPCVFDNMWDDVSSKCRGLIVHKFTGEIIARSFEKFHNYGTDWAPETMPDNLPKTAPLITTKLDGNLITLYNWNGRTYAASKGSFHSEHADWANAWLEKHYGPRPCFYAEGRTMVCEMIAETVQHHVVHYGVEGLFLLAVINNETGEELDSATLEQWAAAQSIKFVKPLTIDMAQALKDNNKNEEGYVLAWPRPGQTPVRVKVKFIDFLRLQRLLHSTGPKEILDYMRYPHLQCYLREALDPKLSTPEFIEFVKGWQHKLQDRFDFIYLSARVRCTMARGVCEQYSADDAQARRKRYAQIVNGQGDYNIFAPFAHPAVCFAMLDGDEERVTKAVWKQVEPLVTGNTRFIREDA